MKTLLSLSEGDTATVYGVQKGCPMCSRLLDIGLTSGADVTRLQTSLFGDPTAYLIRNAVIAIRKEDANSVIIN